MKALKGSVGLEIQYITGLKQGSEEVVIYMDCGSKLTFNHEQDCCEHVYLEDFELDCDLSYATIISVKEVSSNDPEYQDSFEEHWTFYKIETTKGGLWLRWLGESEYYSTKIDALLELRS